MTPSRSVMGRRQFLMAAGAASLSALGMHMGEAFFAPAAGGVAVASEKSRTEGIEKMNVSEKFKMPQQVIDEALSPGYGPREIGYEQLENGDAMVSVRARFDHCNGKMLDWWMADYVKGTKEYQLWHQDHTTFEWDESKKPGSIINATHISGEYLGDEFIPMWISFYNPAEILGITEYPDNTISTVTCASIWLENQQLFASLLQVIRETYYGCEMRLRFNAINTKAEDCVGLMEHSMDEMANLAGFLPGLYAREQQRKSSNPRL